MSGCVQIHALGRGPLTICGENFCARIRSIYYTAKARKHFTERRIEELEQNRKLPKWLFIFAGVLGIGLTAEFCMFSYGLLKIIRYLILLTAMLMIAWIDWHDKRIPNKILVLLLEARGIILLLEWAAYPGYGISLFLSALLGMLMGGGLFLLAGGITRGGIGMGDVKLFAVVGSYMGIGSILAVIFLAAITSAVYSVIMLLLKKVKLKEEIPFAPFILIGTILTMALGM